MYGKYSMMNANVNDIVHLEGHANDYGRTNQNDVSAMRSATRPTVSIVLFSWCIVSIQYHHVHRHSLGSTIS